MGAKSKKPTGADRAADERERAEAKAWRDISGHAVLLSDLGVSPLWAFLSSAAYAEWRVQEWLRLNGWPKHDLVYHVHEVLADLSAIRAPSVQDALIDLAGMEEDGCAPDALDEIRHALVRRGKPGPRRSFSERKLDDDDLDAFDYARRSLRSAAVLYQRTPGAVDPTLARHVREMKRRRLRLERYALLLWAERTGRRSRDWMTLQPDLDGLRDRVRKRKQPAEK